MRFVFKGANGNPGPPGTPGIPGRRVSIKSTISFCPLSEFHKHDDPLVIPRLNASDILMALTHYLSLSHGLSLSLSLSLRVSLAGSLSQGLSRRVSLAGSLSQGLSRGVSLSLSLSLIGQQEAAFLLSTFLFITSPLAVEHVM